MWMDSWVFETPVDNWPRYAVERQSDVAHGHNTIVQVPALFRVFVPSNPVVVLANSNAMESEVETHCTVPVLRRKGGGGTVFLDSGCLVLTLAFYAKDIFNNAEYFESINALWMAAFADHGVRDLCQKGISDIAVGDHKIAGTSLFRRRHLLLYQGSFLINPDFESIAGQLRHPSKEPDYRQGRSHREFLTSLRDLQYETDMVKWQQRIGMSIASRLVEFLGRHMICAL